MVTKYFESVNTNNTIQINDSFYNHALVQKGSFTTVMSNNGISLGAFGSVSYTSQTGTQPIIAFRAKSRLCAISNTARSGNTWTWTFCTTEWDQNHSPVVPGGTVEYWIFDKPPLVSDSKLGMQIFRADGTLLFDALYPYLTIVDSFQWSTSYYDGSGNLAAIQCNPVINTGFDGPSGGLYLNFVDLLGCYLNQGIQAQVGWMYSANSFRSSLQIGLIVNQDPEWLLVDVSRL